VAWLVTARLVAGMAIGIASFVAPLYISETAPVGIRGKLVSINQVALTSGNVISYLIDYAFSGAQAWRWMFALAGIPASVFAVELMLIPDSPRWLAARGHLGRAEAVLKRIRSPEQAAAEIKIIQQSTAQQKGRWSELLSPLLRPAMIVGVGLAVAQQITGINTIIYWGSPSSCPKWAAPWVGSPWPASRSMSARSPWDWGRSSGCCCRRSIPWEFAAAR
jgi:MFS family permease